MTTERTFLRHAPCPSCGSRNNLAIYSDGYEKCFGCDHYAYESSTPSTTNKASFNMEDVEFLEIETRAISARNLSEETCKKFQYGFGEDAYGNPVHVTNVYDRKGRRIGQKTRDPKKNFMFIGNSKHSALFGQNVWKAGGKFLVITEGEIDAMSVSQLRGNRWETVSILKGSKSAKQEIENNIEFVDSFEKVIFMFDNDDPGREAALQCAEVLTPGKAFVARLPLKDANECLVAGKGKDVVDAIFGAKEYRPDGIVSGNDITLDELQAAAVRGLSIPYPELDAMLRGLRKAELTLVTAGSGIGKSTWISEVKYHLVKVHGEKVGNVYLEESYKKTAQRDIAIANNIPLGVLRANPDAITQEQWDSGLNVVKSQEYYDHFGSLDSSRLITQMNYMVTGLKCEWIILDHISMVVSGTEEKGSSERKDLDVLMTNLRTFIERTGVGIIAVVHLKRASDKKSFNEGGQVSLTDLRGSASLEQLSDNIIAAERNQQDEQNKNLSQLRLLKNREFGDLGLADVNYYDTNTGRLLPAPKEMLEESAGEELDLGEIY